METCKVDSHNCQQKITQYASTFLTVTSLYHAGLYLIGNCLFYLRVFLLLKITDTKDYAINL